MSFFDQFRRSDNNFSSYKTFSSENIFFQINFDEYGAFILVVDKKGKEVNADYRSYQKAIRNFLRALDYINERSSFVINWDKPSDKIYLNDHDFLVEQLRLCNNIVDEEMNTVTVSEYTAVVEVSLSKNRDHEDKNQETYISDVVLYLEGKTVDIPRFLSEDTVLVDQQLVSVEPLGKGFSYLSYFGKAEIFSRDLPFFFSLLFSQLDNIHLSYEDFTVVKEEEKILSKPCLIFQKIDVDDSLIMSVSQILPGFNPDVLEQFELYKYAEINELEKKIIIRDIQQLSSYEAIDEIERLLWKYRSKKKKEEREEVVRDGSMFIIPKEIAGRFIYNELPNLLLQYQIMGAEKLREYKITATPPKLSLSLDHNIDFFEGEVTLDFDGQPINLFDVISQFQKNRYILLNDGSHALINEDYIRKLERIFKKKGKKAQVSFFDLPLVEELIKEKVEAPSFKRSREIYEGFNQLANKKLKLPEVNAKLRPYQKKGHQWLKYLESHNLGGCLADDMGLGKTLQALSLLANYYPKEKKPSLIVMPRSLLFNWKKEVEKFTPQLRTYTFYGNDRDIELAFQSHLIFTTYAIMRNEVKVLKELEFFYIILDESQNIKNISAQTTKAAMLLKAENRLALSGTPIENNLGELYSLFRFLNPGMFGTLNQFNKDYLYPIQKLNDQEATQTLRKKIYPFILRRLKKDVLKDLPDKIEQTLYVEMSDTQKKLYEQRRLFYQLAIKNQIKDQGIQQSRFFVFQALNELRQIASVPENINEKISSPKVELLMEQLLDTIANGHKALIFVNFLAAIETISKELDDAGIDFVSMSGSTRNRQVLVDRFQNTADCKVFLMTLKTGGTGLNLTAADTIFIFDPWWNIAAENQAIDRAHRIGQQNKVLAYRLIAQDTIEEKIMQLQQLKKELFDNIIGADSTSLKSLSEEDINYILS